MTTTHYNSRVSDLILLITYSSREKKIGSLKSSVLVKTGDGNWLYPYTLLVFFPLKSREEYNWFLLAWNKIEWDKIMVILGKICQMQYCRSKLLKLSSEHMI